MKSYRVQHTCDGCLHFADSSWQCIFPPNPRVTPNGVCDLWEPEPRRVAGDVPGPIAQGVINEYVMPCPRQTKRQRNKKYKVTKGVIGVNMVEAFAKNGRIPQFPFIRGPFLFALVIHIPPTKQSKASGEEEFPETAGDFDNYIKSFLDSAKTQGVIKDDNPKWFRGIAPLGPKRSMVHLGEAWKFEWAFYVV